MRNKRNTVFLATFGILMLSLLAVKLQGAEFLPDREIQIQGANLAQVALPPACNLEEKVEIAKKLLESSPPLQIVEKSERIRQRNGKYITRYILVRKEISLVVLNLDSCNISEERYWIDQEGIEKGNNLRKLHLENPGDIPKFEPVNPQSKLSVFVNWWNNHNSDLSVYEHGSSDHDRYVVLANRFALSNDNFAYPDEIKGARYSDIVYVPYSDPIHTAVLDELGNKFMSKAVDEAGDELDSLGVESRAYPGQLVTGAITRELVKNILLTEQIDPSLIFASDDNGRKLAGRVFIRYATNGEKAFRYTFSKTGASGAGQIMPGTYGTVPGAYTKAKLMRDVDIGRVDLKNGLKATFLILDMKLSEIEAKARATSKTRSVWAKKTSEQKLEAVAASYNGGSSKYLALSGTISLAVRETVDFVRKYKMVRDLKLFN